MQPLIQNIINQQAPQTLTKYQIVECENHTLLGLYIKQTDLDIIKVYAILHNKVKYLGTQLNINSN